MPGYSATIAILLLVTGAVAAEAQVSFSLAGKNYLLKGGHAVVSQRNGKTQLVLASRDATAKAMFAITVELAPGALDRHQELTAEYNPLSLVVMNPRGIYSLVPHTTLARDDFIQYTRRETVETGQLEDDPTDHPELRLQECQSLLRHSDACARSMKKQRRKQKKMLAVYKKHGPTWVGKSRAERIRTGDGIMREEKFRDTSLIVRLNPLKTEGKSGELTGSFAGVVLFNEGSKQGVIVPIQNGKFTLPVQKIP